MRMRSSSGRDRSTLTLAGKGPKCSTSNARPVTQSYNLSETSSYRDTRWLVVPARAGVVQAEPLLMRVSCWLQLFNAMIHQKELGRFLPLAILEYVCVGLHLLHFQFCPINSSDALSFSAFSGVRSTMGSTYPPTAANLPTRSDQR